MIISLDIWLKIDCEKICYITIYVRGIKLNRQVGWTLLQNYIIKQIVWQMEASEKGKWMNSAYLNSENGAGQLTHTMKILPFHTEYQY